MGGPNSLPLPLSTTLRALDGQRPGDKLSLLEFTQQTFHRYQPAPHHERIAAALERVATGECQRLMLFMPPRHGKSELASVRFPAWYLGKFPDRKFIAASYAANLSFRFSRRARNLIASPTYQELFPGVQIAGDASAVAFWAIAGREGEYSAAGIGSGITGTGADVLLIDDPVKDAAEALSMTYREAAYEWFTSTAFTRLDEAAGAIIVIQTRWHEDDLAGKLLADAIDGGEFAPGWEVLSFPALAEEGDALGRAPGQALWPVRFPERRLQEIRTTVGPNWWEALYQQRPPEALGGRYFRAFQPQKQGQPWHVWPLAFAREHYKVGPGAPFPPAHWPRWAGLDGGVRDPYCCLFFCRAPDRRVFLTRELYAAQVLVPDQALTVRGHVVRDGEQLLQIRADPAMWNARANIGVSDVDIYAQHGVWLTKGYNRRVPGWRRLLEALQPLDDGYPRLVVLEGAAPNLLRTLPRLTADPNDPEDVEDGQEDHAADALRYGINPAAAAPEETRAAEVRPYVDGHAPRNAGVLGAPRRAVQEARGTREGHRVLVRDRATGKLVEAGADHPQLQPVAPPVVDDRDREEEAALGYTGVQSRW